MARKRTSARVLKDLADAVSKIRISQTQIEVANVGSFKFKVGTKFANKIRWSDLINQGLRVADGIIMTELSIALDEAMASSVWDWSGVKRKSPGYDTKRKNGEIASSPRDIIDMGKLYGSGVVNARLGQVSVKYNSPYALMVHYGGYITPYGNKRAESAYVPGRPWVQSVLVGGGPVEKYDVAGVYYREILASMKSQLRG